MCCQNYLDRIVLLHYGNKFRTPLSRDTRLISSLSYLYLLSEIIHGIILFIFGITAAEHE